MTELDHHLLIHEGCGGKVRWVQDIERPGVGWVGRCLHCGSEPLPVEGIIPLEEFDPETRLKSEDYVREELAKLEWNNKDSYEENQERLTPKVEPYVRN